MVREKVNYNDKELCSPMVLDNLVHYYQGKDLDGCYINSNANRLLFEDGWGLEVCNTISKSLL